MAPIVLRELDSRGVQYVCSESTDDDSSGILDPKFPRLGHSNAPFARRLTYL